MELWIIAWQLLRAGWAVLVAVVIFFWLVRESGVNVFNMPLFIPVVFLIILGVLAFRGFNDLIQR